MQRYDLFCTLQNYNEKNLKKVFDNHENEPSLVGKALEDRGRLGSDFAEHFTVFAKVEIKYEQFVCVAFVVEKVRQSTHRLFQVVALVNDVLGKSSFIITKISGQKS